MNKRARGIAEELTVPQRVAKWVVMAIRDSHIYENKWEGIMKACAFLMSWFVGVYPIVENGDIGLQGAAYLVFGYSIIMEFVPMLVNRRKRFVCSVLPVILVLLSIVVLISAFSCIGGKSILDTDHVNLVGYSIIGMILLDSLVSLASTVTYWPLYKIENRLRRIKIGDENNV